jgi:hypothetical protein
MITFEKNKIYKLRLINSISMLPGDLKRSPDESFSILKFFGGSNE